MQQASFNVRGVSKRDIFKEIQRFIQFPLCEGDLSEEAPSGQGIWRFARDFIQTRFGFIRFAGARLKFRVVQTRSGSDRRQLRCSFEFLIRPGKSFLSQ